MTIEEIKITCTSYINEVISRMDIVIDKNYIYDMIIYATHECYKHQIRTNFKLDEDVTKYITMKCMMTNSKFDNPKHSITPNNKYDYYTF